MRFSNGLKVEFDLICVSPYRKLTKEEFERPNKEDRLTKVDSKALEEEVKVCRQRVKEIQDKLKRTEKSYKAQIIKQEQKSHENWVCTIQLFFSPFVKETTCLISQPPSMAHTLGSGFFF